MKKEYSIIKIMFIFDRDENSEIEPIAVALQFSMFLVVEATSFPLGEQV